MKNKYLILSSFLLLFLSINNYAQETTIKLNGIVRTDSIFLENINIINKTQNLGASSNSKGAFTIYTALGDSILFSSINYKNRIIKITDTHIINKTLIVYLEERNNELDEITLSSKIRLNFGKIDMQKGIVLDNSQNTYKKAPNSRRLTDPTYGNSGVNFISIFKLITKNLRKKRRDKKTQKDNTRRLINEFPEKLITKYKYDFFIEDLKIPQDQVYLFLDYCQDNGLKTYILSDEITIKNFLVKQSINYNKLKNN